MQKKRIALLQRMPIFGGVRADVLQFILDLSAIIFVRKSSYFFRENDKADSMFILQAGKVAVLKGWEGHQYLLGDLAKGDCFGEMALMDLSPRSASVLAVEDCAAIELSSNSLFKIYERDLEQFTIIQMNMGREVSRRLREADERLFHAGIGIASVGKKRIYRFA
jgi:CRP-like cAMP-binding protein